MEPVIEEQTQRTKLLSGIAPPFENDDDGSEPFGDIEEQSLSMGEKKGPRKGDFDDLDLSDGNIEI